MHHLWNSRGYFHIKFPCHFPLNVKISLGFLWNPHRFICYVSTQYPYKFHWESLENPCNHPPPNFPQYRCGFFFHWEPDFPGELPSTKCPPSARIPCGIRMISPVECWLNSTTFCVMHCSCISYQQQLHFFCLVVVVAPAGAVVFPAVCYGWLISDVWLPQCSSTSCCFSTKR